MTSSNLVSTIAATLAARPTPPEPIRGREALQEAAEKLEAAFLAEMLKAAGVGRTPESFGGGAGEDQFSSFLRDEQAGAMVKSGGIGLAQSLFEALKERADAGH